MSAGSGLIIYQFDGPDTYIQEVGSRLRQRGQRHQGPVPDRDGLQRQPISPASRRLYTSLGMEESPTGTFSVTDATGRGSITEYTLKYTMGSGLVLRLDTRAQLQEQTRSRS
jgi:hypothetical protein